MQKWKQLLQVSCGIEKSAQEFHRSDTF